MMGSRLVAVVGLGIMGSAIAANLVASGHSVQGYDPSPGGGEALAAAGGVAHRSAAEACTNSEIVLLSLPAAAALDETAAALAGRLKPGAVVADLSTLAIADKERARNALARDGIPLLDCPLSGTGAQAVTRDLIVFASGDEAAWRRLEPVVPSFARASHFLGPFGAGTTMKFIANLLVAIHNVAAAEAMVLGMKAGLDPQLTLDVLAGSAATSRMLQVRGPSMVAGAYPPMIAADVFRKDLALIAEFAASLRCPAPLFSATLPLYSAALAQGLGSQDTAAVCTVLERLAGVTRA